MGLADQAGVDRATAVLVATESTEFSTARTVDMLEAIDGLQGSLRILLDVIGRLTPTRSERLAAQHDEQFRNLARAARMEIHAAAGSIKRLGAFERALLGMVDDEESR
ncbi:hypothetical protein [Streptomyces xanthochromogenes]|uniref:hypothetical protein n=1 Tax=Streptomyces xanthochromogenes TaxID=67384 RepID=UPI002F423A88